MADWSPMSMDDQSCHFSSFYAILYFSNHLLVLATSCIMYDLVPTPHSIPDYILITSAGTPGWLPVLGSQPTDDAPPVITTTTTAPICCFQHIIHRIVTLYTGYTAQPVPGRSQPSPPRRSAVKNIYYTSIHHLASPQRDAACGRGPGRSNVYCLF